MIMLSDLEHRTKNQERGRQSDTKARNYCETVGISQGLKLFNGEMRESGIVLLI